MHMCGANTRDGIMPEGMRGKGQNRGYFEQIIKRPGYLTRCGGSGEVEGKADSKIFHWVIIKRGGSFNRK